MLIKEARKGEKPFNGEEMKRDIAADEKAAAEAAKSKTQKVKDSATAAYNKVKGFGSKAYDATKNQATKLTAHFNSLSPKGKTGVLAAAAAALAGSAYAAHHFGHKKDK